MTVPVRRRPDPVLLAVALGVTFGTLVRTVQYAHNRSLWVDEAMLALGMGGASFRDLFGRLEFSQVAPLGFLMTAKSLALAFGDGERILRLVPFVSSIAALALFYPATRLLVGRGAAAAATILFAVSGPAIYYAVDFKQYAVEIFVTLLLVWAFAHAKRRQYGPSALARLSAVSVLSLLFSLPAVAVIAAAGGALLMLEVRAGDRAAARRLLWAMAIPAVAFVALYLGVIRASADREYLVGAWRAFFLPLPPLSIDAVQVWLERPWRLMPESFGLPTAGLALFACLIGVADLWRRDRAGTLILVAPLAAAVALAAGALYPLGDRLAHYLIPVVLLVAGAGAGWLARRSRPAAMVLVGLLAFHPTLSAAKRLLHPTEREEARPVLATVAARSEPGLGLYVHWTARPAFAYYRERYPLEDFRIVEGRYPAGRLLAVAGETDDPAGDFEATLPLMRPEAWFVFTGNWPDSRQALRVLRARGTLVDSVTATGAAAYRVRFP